MSFAEAAVLFDLDGTLVDSEILAERAVEQAFSRVGYRISAADVGRRFGGMTDRAMVEAVEAEIGTPFACDVVALISEIVAELQRLELRATPGVADLVAALAADDRLLAVVSNSNAARIDRSLALTDLSHFFPSRRRFSAEHVAVGKPAPDLYLHAARSLGISGDRCIAIEDSLTGARAAIAAGIPTIGFVAGSHLHEPIGHGERLRALGVHGIAEDVESLNRLLRAVRG